MFGQAGGLSPDRVNGAPYREMGRAMDVGAIEQWESQSVVDCDGRKIGKLDDVFLEAGTSEAVFAYVKAGMLRRRRFLVPLAGASLSRGRLRVAYQRDQVKGAPQFEPGATLASGIEQDLARHYDIELNASPVGDARRYESAGARKRLQAQARAMTERADELTELGAAMQTARDGLPQADDDRPGDHKPHDEPSSQQPPSA
jgi:hypothetical protein